MPKAKNPSEASANMTNLFVKIPRLKWPCVLQPLHVQSSTFDKNYQQGSYYMEQVPKFDISIVMAKKRTLIPICKQRNKIL